MLQFDRVDGSEVMLQRSVDGREIERSRYLGGEALPLLGGPPEKPEFFDVPFLNALVMRCAGIGFIPRIEDGDKGGHIRHPEAVLVIGRERGTVDRSLGALRSALALTGAGTPAALAAIIGWGVRGGLAHVMQL